MNIKPFALALLATATGSITVEAAPTQSAASITIDAAHPLGPVNKRIFGHNFEAADSIGIFGKTHSLIQTMDGEGAWDDKNRRPDPEAVKMGKQIGLSVLRYPGGCLAHNFDWKETVGPLESRPTFHFGLDEYMQVCKALNAEPVITISDFRGTPQDAADLVEYLNSPASAKHPWAMKRAENGHPAPYGVRWFELGNESNHGNHDVKPHRIFDGLSYAEYALATGKAMKAVDPTIKLGLQSANGKPADDPWNPIVYQRAGSIADFIIIHRYPVGYSGSTADINQDLLAQACMAAGEQEEMVLQQHHDIIRKYIKRDLPLAMTEYNVGAVQELPHPFRFGYAEGLFSADYIRIMLQPSANMLMANYWQLWNGYWGMVNRNGTVGEYKTRPAYHLYRLWGQHFGDALLPTITESPRLEFPGFSAVRPAHGPVTATPTREPSFTSLPIVLKTGAVSAMASIVGSTPSTVTLRVTNSHGMQYPLIGKVVRPASIPSGSIFVKMSCEARFAPDAGSQYGDIGLGLCDGRGWEATHSAVALDGLGNARTWQPFSTTFVTLPDVTSIDVVARLETGDNEVSGQVEIRNLCIEAKKGQDVPAYAALTSTASLSRDGKTCYLIVFNKSSEVTMTAPIALKGFVPTSANRWTVNGPSLTAGAWSDPPVREVETGVPVPIDRGKLTVTFPAHSMTALELYAK
ncbi:MAG TPA: hypothetical protein VGK19_10360 [Capsulimonadaceae bacterium]|jgi:alpha-N-arabinofuranosidase